MDSETVDQAGSTPVSLTEASAFDEWIDHSDVLIVDFYADWCGPCQMMEPVLETIAAETEATVLKVDVDAFQALAAEHDVRGVPTLKVYANGEPVNRLVGYQDESNLRKSVANLSQ